MQTRVIILVENTACAPNLRGEYGFAALIEQAGKKILFDTGSGDALIHNSRTKGIDLSDLDALVISHGHFDHTGGLRSLIDQYNVPVIYAHSRLFNPRPFPLANGTYKEIGCAFSKRDIEAKNIPLVEADNFQEIWPGIFLSGEIPRLTEYEDAGGNFKIEINGQLFDDEILDDLALIIKLSKGLVIISGCAHAGMINIINNAMEKTGVSKIIAFIGGTHLFAASESRIEKTAADLKKMDIDKIVLCHCTGFYAAARLYNELGMKIIKGDAGMVLNFGGAI
ncbi:MBL fold metallo-hydrolase [Syntrophomonas palmitatica]|uniref:MBL fold metallo-hydrolase n=1 Tax=Syntrophomonas palmitatica TaxID=402877 RepID=UPI0006CF3D3A|nr:MBL fold metallo-hydrolase [Syntrophomonas palmitatica]